MKNRRNLATSRKKQPRIYKSLLVLKISMKAVRNRKTKLVNQRALKIQMLTRLHPTHRLFHDLTRTITRNQRATIKQSRSQRCCAGDLETLQESST